MRQFVDNTFDPLYKNTVAADFTLKVIEIDGKPIHLQLWDIAGQERLGGIPTLFCRNASGAFVVCDLTRFETLQNAAEWKVQIDQRVV